MSGRWCLLFVLSGAMVLGNSGCAELKALRRDLASNDYVDDTEVVNNSWTSIAGKDGRGDKMRETDPDPLWTLNVMSEKARDVERNLGIDH
ncbi:MAG: hypothetical protein ACE5KM_07940 [Planctomycetaceae bacterium]